MLILSCAYRLFVFNAVLVAAGQNPPLVSVTDYLNANFNNAENYGKLQTKYARLS